MYSFFFLVTLVCCMTLSRGRALNGFTCSCRVLDFVLCTRPMKPKAKEVPNSLCLCYRSGATFSFWCNASAGRAEVQRAHPKVELQGALAQLRELCAHWESSSAPCSAGLRHRHCSLGVVYTMLADL